MANERKLMALLLKILKLEKKSLPSTIHSFSTYLATGYKENHFALFLTGL